MRTCLACVKECKTNTAFLKKDIIVKHGGGGGVMARAASLFQGPDNCN